MAESQTLTWHRWRWAGNLILLVAALAALGIWWLHFRAHGRPTVSPRAVHTLALPARNHAIKAAKPSAPGSPAKPAPPSPLPRCGQRPVGGPIILGYGWIYSPTLRDWRWHDGLDLKASPGSTVVAGWAGRVEQVISNGPGSVTVVEADGSYRITYAGLTDIRVAVGTPLTVGAAIGRVGQSELAEAAEPAHLHLSLAEDGRPLNPWGYLRP